MSTFLLHRPIDWSLLTNGFHIPTEFHPLVYARPGGELHHGDKRGVKIMIDGEENNEQGGQKGGQKNEEKTINTILQLIKDNPNMNKKMSTMMSTMMSTIMSMMDELSVSELYLI